MIARQLFHQTVSGHFRQHRRRCDAGTLRIRLDKRAHLCRHGHRGGFESAQCLGYVVVRPVEYRADVQPIRMLLWTVFRIRPCSRVFAALVESANLAVTRATHAEGAFHTIECAQCGDAERMRDAPCVDLRIARRTDCKTVHPRLQWLVETLAPMLGERLGICEILRHGSLCFVEISRKERGRAHHHRTCQRTTSHFVESDDYIEPVGGNLPFQCKRRRHTAPFSTPKTRASSTDQPASGTFANTSL